MTNTERIQANNAELREAIEMAENLPEAGGYPAYSGVYVVVPSPDNSIVLNTTEKVLTQDVTVKKIPFYEVSNNKGGTTVTIGKEVI